MRDIGIDDVIAQALRAEMQLYGRILARCDFRKYGFGTAQQDKTSRRVEARLRAAQRLWNTRYAPTLDPDDIPF